MRIKLLVTSFLILSCLLIPIDYLAAQQVIVNSKGEKIVIFPDGSWRHFEPADSVLIRPNLRSDSPFNEPPNLQGENNPPLDPTLGKSSDKRLAIEFANQLRHESDMARAILVEATNDKFNVEAKLTQAIENSNLVEVDIRAKLEDDFEKAIEEVKNAKLYHKKISQFAEEAMNISNLDGKKRDKKLAKLMAKHSSFIATTEWKPEYFEEQELMSVTHSVGDEDDSKTSKKVSGEEDQVPRSKAKSKTKKVKEAATRFIGAETSWSVPVKRSYERQPSECEIQLNEIDAVTQQRRIVVSEKSLFTHTDEELRPYFRDENLIECTAFLSIVEGFKYLTAKFTIASPNARRNFGMLQQQALLRIKLIDGTFLNFYNIQADRGRIDQYSGNTIFTGNYSLGKSAEKLLQKSEVDKMRVVWSTGYEDYDIHEVDFFIDQLKCLNNY